MKSFAGSNHYVQLSLRGSLWFLALATVMGVVSSTLAFGQAGTLDATYGTGGIATVFSAASGNLLNGAAIQADDKVVMVGSNPNDVMVRLNTNGTLDSSFGTNGVVSVNFGVLGPLMTVVIQPNQQILALSSGFGGTAIGRFNSDGSLDTTFGTAGFASVRIISNGEGAIIPMALQPDGSIVIAGNNLMARFTSSGQLDTTFGTGGLAALTNSIATGIAIQPDGSILVSSGLAPQPVLFGAPVLPSPLAGSISRYTGAGSLNTTYGIAGMSSCIASAAAAALQSNGKLLVVGTATSGVSFNQNGAENQMGFAAVRYNTNGSIDTTFNPGGGIGGGGGIVTGFGSSFPFASPFGVAIQSNGAIVLGGTAGTGIQGGAQFTSASFALTRYTSTGQLDTSFGSNGIVTTALSGRLSFVNAVLLQSDGKIVAVGNTGVASGDSFSGSFVAARYLSQ